VLGVTPVALRNAAVKELVSPNPTLMPISVTENTRLTRLGTRRLGGILDPDHSCSPDIVRFLWLRMGSL
jgi:hypothetical protein